MNRFALLAFLTMASGCVETTAVQVRLTSISGAQLSAVKSKVVYSFKDPGSAQFRNITAYRVATGDLAVCGEVNGKNGFGAYVGFKTFYIRLSGDVVKKSFVDQDGPSIATVACREASQGTLSIANTELTTES